ncbi:MAG: glycosyltransferase family 4 protein, partial [Polyangiaceae bacterium]|nr:glycosyltransferase family 4 protein [Polyangiaceae bacterium]
MTRIRRVLMSGDTVGGVWSYCLDLARALGEQNVEVVLATMGNGATRAQLAEAAATPSLCLHDRKLALEWMDDPWGDVEAAGAWLLALEQKFEPDVVHINGFAHAALPFRAPVICVAHSSVDTWFAAVKNEPLPRRYERYAAEAARGLRSAHTVVAPTRALLSALVRTYGPLPNGRVVSNGVFVERYSSGAKEGLVLAAGRPWDEAKNVVAIACAARKLHWPVELAGARDHDTVPAGIRSLGLLARHELAARMAKAPIFLHPARYEPFGLAPVEAALSGAALVLGDIPSLREVWEDAAAFVAPGDHDGI